MERIVVIGASAGGVETLRHVVGALPRDFPCPVAITLHIGANRSELPALLSRAGPLPASHPYQGQHLEAGKLYIAPPDHHMLVKPGTIILTRGPKENWARPAIDPMFRSAARGYGVGTIGVILTGGLNDGTAGLFEIKAAGGTTVVQTPSDAFNAEMPQSALAHVEVDHVCPARNIAALLADLVMGNAQRRAPSSAVSSQEVEMSSSFTLDQPVAITCPDCGGALERSECGTLTQFTCHIGHRYSLEVMIAAQFAAMEQFLGSALRSLNERRELCRLMSLRDELNRHLWTSAQQDAVKQATVLRELLAREWLKPRENPTSNRHDADATS
jgi:two-component system chemotaxis response regulator CheB